MTEPTPSSDTTASPVALSAPEIRKQFIAFFEQRAGHTFVASSPVVPHDDPTLLFTNAGMNQFKPVFQGVVQPGSPLAGLKRAVNSQKCIRAGGKHNDLDDVGKDGYHHTFFEMLGNWSFGDYFKAEAIQWAWELLTDIWGVDKNRLYATYFEGNAEQGLEPDHEARDLWLKYLPEERVLPGNMKDNFWEMGDTGPCGPCSEIHYDSRSEDETARQPGRELVNMDHEQVIEIWNLVFIQFDRTANGLNPLPAKHVDTGMGLERIVRVLQHKQSNYDTDVFTPIFEAIRRVTQQPRRYGGVLCDPIDTAYRVIADHIRTLCFSIADGAVPSNEGRGYVLRRILRRAVRYGRQTLGMDGPFFAALVPTVVEHFGAFFPELRERESHITSVIADEEESFGRTLDHGIDLFDKAAAGAANKTISAQDAFKLYDTHGFPIDLTQLMAEERGMTVDVAGFERLMEEARERSRSGGAGADDPIAKLVLPTDAVAKLQQQRIKPTDDARKFTSNLATATVRAIWNGTDFDETVTAEGKADRRVALVLDRTNFYAEMGGQVADSGTLRVTREAAAGIGVGSGGTFAVEQVRRSGDYVVHIGRCTKNEIRVGDVVDCKLDTDRRRAIAANHTATHLLNLALRRVLGDHVDQKGSLVAEDRLRFDFSHNAPLSADEAKSVQELVTAWIGAALPVHAELASLEEAKRINGVRAMFGETYPDPVRVVSVGPTVSDLLADPTSEAWLEKSVEFCGGTHLKRTDEAEAFALVGEENVAKGVRRLVALTGDLALAATRGGEALRSRLEGAASLPDRHLSGEVQALTAEIDGAEIPLHTKAELRAGLAKLAEKAKAAQKQAAKAGREEAVGAARAIAEGASGAFVVAEMPGVGTDRSGLMSAMDAVTSKRPELAVMLIGVDEADGKLAIAAKVPDVSVKKGLKAGDWVRAAAEACGGKGGGRPDSAQGGGTEPAKLPDAIAAAQALASEKLG
jgi:alanyl-tRNA synthetase